MSDKVICPWCGWEMELHCRKIKNSDDFMANYYCATCDTESPGLIGRDEEALIQAVTQRAIRRYQPENRVLALDELKTFCKANPDAALVIELKHTTPSIVKWVDVSEIATRLRLASFRGAYQKGWCCWLRKPTNKERAAVSQEGKP